MRFRISAFVALAALAGCRTGDSTKPEQIFNGSPSLVISDGAHSNADAQGNPDFFFLPPMAADPSRSSNYEVGAFNPNLTPTVKICKLPGTTAPVGGCGTTYIVEETISRPSDESYHYNWSVPDSAQVFYRIEVWVDDTRLGFADVQTSPNPQDIKKMDGKPFYGAKDGTTLPIKFRAERYALPCDAPGAGDGCASKTINFVAGGTINTELEGDDAGVIIKPGSGNRDYTLTIQECEDLNPRVTDLRTFGPCLKVTSNPALPEEGLAVAATVYICAVIDMTHDELSHAQSERVTLHKYDDPPGELRALRHALACGAPPPPTVGGLLGSLKRGAFKHAGRQAVAMMAPKTLGAATRRLDVGAGGEALDWSDFQFALPSKLSIAAGNNQTGPAGSTLPVAPKVIVTDLEGDPVEGARVRFAATSGACEVLGNVPGSESNSDGEVTDAPWTIVAGVNTRAACGRGIAGTLINGPRPGVDPFQPLSLFFDDVPAGPAVLVSTGAVVFKATGTNVDPFYSNIVGFQSGGYTTYGPYANNSGPELPPSAWSTTLVGSVGAQAPFRENAGGCGPGAVNGPFTLGSDIYAVKSINVPVNGTLVATIRVDNDVRIWVDGVERTEELPFGANNGAFGSHSSYVAPWWRHELCVTEGPAVLTMPITAGTHTIALRARDRGGNAYLDLQVVLNAPAN